MSYFFSVKFEDTFSDTALLIYSYVFIFAKQKFLCFPQDLVNTYLIGFDCCVKKI